MERIASDRVVYSVLKESLYRAMGYWRHQMMMMMVVVIMMIVTADLNAGNVCAMSYTSVQNKASLYASFIIVIIAVQME